MVWSKVMSSFDKMEYDEKSKEDSSEFEKVILMNGNEIIIILLN